MPVEKTPTHSVEVPSYRRGRGRRGSDDIKPPIILLTHSRYRSPPPETPTPDLRYAEERGLALRAKAAQEAAAAAIAVKPAEPESISRGCSQDSSTVNIEHDSSANTARAASSAVPKTGATDAAGLHNGDRAAGGGGGGGDRSDGSGGGGEAAAAAGGHCDSEPMMEFMGCDGKVHTIALLREVIYLTDMDVTR